MGPVLFHFTKGNQTFTRFALELQISNPKTKKLKEIGTDMEDAIFNGMQSLFPDVSKPYCVRHMKQHGKIKTGKFSAKFKRGKNEKVF